MIQDNVDYMDWVLGEFNDDYYMEDCVEFFQLFSFYWNDVLCSVKSNFICEKM